MERYFKFSYRDGAFAEYIVFSNKTDAEIERHIERVIAEEYNRNPNPQWHIDRSCVTETSAAEYRRCLGIGLMGYEEMED